MRRVNRGGSAQLMENSALGRQVCSVATHEPFSLVFPSSFCRCATLHLCTLSHLPDLFLTSASLLFCLPFDLFFCPFASFFFHMLTLAQGKSGPSALPGSCLAEITVFFKSVTKKTLTLETSGLLFKGAVRLLLCCSSQQSVIVSC